MSGFNPCCIGLGLQTQYQGKPVVTFAMMFQSLLYWIRPSDARADSRAMLYLALFQSLLYWIRPSDLEHDAYLKLYQLVSILVVLD